MLQWDWAFPALKGERRRGGDWGVKVVAAARTFVDWWWDINPPHYDSQIMSIVWICCMSVRLKIIIIIPTKKNTMLRRSIFRSISTSPSFKESKMEDNDRVTEVQMLSREWIKIFLLQTNCSASTLHQHSPNALPWVHRQEVRRDQLY